VNILIVLAGLMGACGIVLAAANAHLAAGTGLDSAAYLLLFHAAAILGGAALVRLGLLWRPAALAALAGFALGGALFAGDIASRTFAGHRLFPFAAPTGGTLLIAAWLTLTVAAIAAMRRPTA